MKKLDINVKTDTDADESRVHVNMKNPITGADNYVTVVFTDEGVIVDVWGDSADWPEASVHSLWSDLAEDEESENESENEKEFT